MEEEEAREDEGECVSARFRLGKFRRMWFVAHLVECHCPHKLTVAWSLVTMREKPDLDGSLPNITSSRSTIALLTAETWSLWHTM